MRQKKFRPSALAVGYQTGKGPVEKPFGIPWKDPGSIRRIGHGGPGETTERPGASLHPDLCKGLGAQVDQDLLG